MLNFEGRFCPSLFDERHLPVDMTTHQLRRALISLNKGALIFHVAAEIGVDGDLIARVVRHYGYYKPDGTFHQDLIPPQRRSA